MTNRLGTKCQHQYGGDQEAPGEKVHHRHDFDDVLHDHEGRAPDRRDGSERQDGEGGGAIARSGVRLHPRTLEDVERDRRALGLLAPCSW
jgi:hypothetical protein